MTTYFHGHEFCCSPKKPSSGSTKAKSGKGKSKSAKSHFHPKQNQNLLQIQAPNHQLQTSPLHSPKHRHRSPKHGCHSPKHLLPSPSPSYYHIAPPSPTHQLPPASPNFHLAPPSSNHLLHSPSCQQLHLSPSYHQLHHHCQNQPPASPSHLLSSQSTHQIYHHQHHVPPHSPSHHSFHQYQHHHEHPPPAPPLPHASQSLSIHPFHSPQLPLCSALGGYGWSTLPTNLVTRGSKGKSPNLKDSLKKTPSKSKAKGKADSKPWPNDTYIWTSRSTETPQHVPHIHHFPQIQAHIQVGLGSINDSPWIMGKPYAPYAGGDKKDEILPRNSCVFYNQCAQQR